MNILLAWCSIVSRALMVAASNASMHRGNLVDLCRTGAGTRMFCVSVKHTAITINHS